MKSLLFQIKVLIFILETNSLPINMWPIWRVNQMEKDHNKNEPNVNFFRHNLLMSFENFKLNVAKDEKKRREEKRRQKVKKYLARVLVDF